MTETGRPREGAWIEMLFWMAFTMVSPGRPREGAWIEML